MKKILAYIILMSYLFALLDWRVVHYTRWQHREYLDWMHAHERIYATTTRTLEGILCLPCFIIKPVFYDALMHAEAGIEEQEAITHAPRPTLYGFYQLPDRKDKWTFVSWQTWILYWLVPSFVWYAAWRYIYEQRSSLVRFVNRNRLHNSGLVTQTQVEKKEEI